MIKLNLFIEDVSTELKTGLRVLKDTNVEYDNKNVHQEIHDLTLETTIDNVGTNGVNSYASRTFLKINLNEGDILQFNDEKGFFLPNYPLIEVEEGIDSLNSIVETSKNIIEKENQNFDTSEKEEK